MLAYAFMASCVAMVSCFKRCEERRDIAACLDSCMVLPITVFFILLLFKIKGSEC